MPERLTPLHVFLSCFGIASLAGLAALLRSGQPLTWRNVAAAALYSGVFGLVIGLLWYQYFGGNDNLFFLIGISGLAGLGGMSLIDVAVQALLRGFRFRGVEDSLETEDEEDDEAEEGE